ncbi:hypothetical protein [Pseudarthrobacter sp. NBSH8]|uniref:hypothetical protein n=1 Tax=Pseudarthrobacter sp. NBSH8 TaxID=2596911 RepID=UPI00351ABEA7
MSNELVLRGRIVSAALEVADGAVAVDGGVITFAGPASDFPGNPGPVRTDRILLPGLVDLHCHGAKGSDFAEGSEEGPKPPPVTCTAGAPPRSLPAWSPVRRTRRSGPLRYFDP